MRTNKEKQDLIHTIIELNEKKDLFEQYIDEKYIDIKFDGEEAFLDILGIKLSLYQCDIIFDYIENDFYNNEEEDEEDEDDEEDDPLDRLKTGLIIDKIGVDND